MPQPNLDKGKDIVFYLFPSRLMNVPPQGTDTVSDAREYNVLLPGSRVSGNLKVLYHYSLISVCVMRS